MDTLKTHPKAFRNPRTNTNKATVNHYSYIIENLFSSPSLESPHRATLLHKMETKNQFWGFPPEA